MNGNIISYILIFLELIVREAFIKISLKYAEIQGNGKLVILFLAAVLAIVLIDENRSDDERRRINPTVFLLSLWSGISYALTVIVSKTKKWERAFSVLISIVIIALSGKLVLSEDAYKASVYYYTDNRISILSVVCILFYLIIYVLLARQLFEKRSERLIFVGFAILLHLFGFYSDQSSGWALFLSPVTVPSIIIHDVMPLLLWLYLIYEDKIKESLTASDETDSDLDDIPEEWDMKKHKIINIRNMAIAFGVLVVAFIACVFVLNQKINSLYDATVLLENAANTKVTADELKASDGTVAVTITISPSGVATVYGSNKKVSVTDCYDLISKYTDKVDKWYLFGDDEDNRAAYDYCIENGIKVVETYVISGVEKLSE